MEYGLRTDFKNFAGGLGILAGDHLKAAKELAAPLVGIGILWKQGYTEQRIAENGQPYDSYHNFRYDFLEDTGVKVKVKIRNRDVYCKVWKVDRFDNASLYLLDTDLPENGDRWITGQLYGWFGEERIAQEIVLGVGGVRALRALGIKADVYHFNEGHAVFAAIELMRELMDADTDFPTAWENVRSKVVFTTHTPVIEGNESHNLDTLEYMGAFGPLSRDQMIQIGGDPFNMTVAGLGLSRAANAVAQLHAETASKMWSHVQNSPDIIGITNGIDHKTWVDSRITRAWREKGDLWAAHMELKAELIDFVHSKAGVKLAADKLLIGFSRRAVPYKRSDLIFHDVDIIGPLLREGRVQIIFAGKAHPLDDTGKGIVANLVEMSRKYPNSVVFLENYDMEIGAMLTRGCDVWLNNPRRPKEASGTSGMKAAMNGVLNFSTLDGWWPEACQHGLNGWQFGDGFVSVSEAEQDKHDLDALYNCLLTEVLPTYYEIRAKWVAMMEASIESTYEQFSARRMLKEYYSLMYSNSN
jgi:starch phosphorylase